MKVIILRSVFNTDCTIGEFFIDGSYVCDAMEPADKGLWKDMPMWYIRKNKVKGKTAIPYGTYEVIISRSPKFKKDLPEVLDVPCFSGIRMHAGNWPKDTEGCIMFGKWRGGSQIKESKLWTDTVIARISDALNKGEKVYLEIRGFVGQIKEDV